MGSLGIPDPSLARAGERVGGDLLAYVPTLPLSSRGALTPLPSPPGEGPSHPRRVSRFQLIQDFSVNYNRVWTPAPSRPLPTPLLPSPTVSHKLNKSKNRILHLLPSFTISEYTYTLHYPF